MVINLAFHRRYVTVKALAYTEMLKIDKIDLAMKLFGPLQIRTNYKALLQFTDTPKQLALPCRL